MNRFLRPVAALLLALLVPACGKPKQGPPMLSVVGFLPGAVVAPDGAVPLESQVFVFFDSLLNVSTVSTTNFFLTPTGGSPVPITLTYNPTFAEVIVTPTALLLSATQYVVTVTTAVTNLAGDAFDGFQIAFTTTAFTDTTATTFGGITAATGVSSGDIHLTWLAASGGTPNMNYDIYISTVSGGQDFSTSFNAPGTIQTPSISADVTGLTSGITYFFVVRAHDGFGNQDRNTVEMFAVAP